MQTKATINKWTLAVVVFCSVAGAKAQTSLATDVGPQNLTITSHTDDFIIQNKRQYAANIEVMDARLEAYKTTYESQLVTVQQQSAMLEVKMREVEKYLLARELLNDLTKHCVQKYKTQLSTVASVQASITNCVTSANTAFATIVTEARNTKINLNNWYNNQLNNLLNDCQKKHANSQLNYTLCAIEAINTADGVTASYLKSFDSQLQKSSCTGEDRVSQAADCTFVIVYSTTKKIGEVTRLIENCTQGKEFCPPCQEPGKPDVCPNKVNVSLKPDYYRNATIVNPFRGLNTTHPCVQVNFDSDAIVFV